MLSRNQQHHRKAKRIGDTFTLGHHVPRGMFAAPLFFQRAIPIEIQAPADGGRSGRGLSAAIQISRRRHPTVLIEPDTGLSNS